MTQNAKTGTLFHLVPRNEVSLKALDHPDNRRFVSSSPHGSLGLEVGFHVSSAPGRVIARLGRNGDLILQRRNVSAVHVAFELHPDTHVLLLSVRAKCMSSVRVGVAGRDEKIEGDCVIIYGKDYDIIIADYEFRLKWRQAVPEVLRTLAVRDYQKALQLQVNVRSRYLPTENDSEVHTWHNTRIHTVGRVLFREADGEPRVLVGEGQFGAVYRAVDHESGHAFAIKVIQLDKYRDIEQARAAAHRELKTLQKLNHKNIIDFLGHDKWDSKTPEIYMPLREGNLRSLKNSPEMLWDDDKLCNEVFEQILSALDYLAVNDICHRDVKPENILYRKDKDSFIFQLADFGLANHRLHAVTKCGTGYYEAPELYPEYGKFDQSPKMDVWSLCATLVDIHSKFSFPPTQANTYAEVLRAIRAIAQLAPDLRPMLRENPHHRASAAQLLVVNFGGRGLSTPRAKVPPIADEPAVQILPASVPAPQAPTNAPAKALVEFPLVKYPREPRQRLFQDAERVPSSPQWLLGGDITKPRAPAPLGPLLGGGITKPRAPAPLGPLLGGGITKPRAPAPLGPLLGGDITKARAPAPLGPLLGGGITKPRAPAPLSRLLGGGITKPRAPAPLGRLLQRPALAQTAGKSPPDRLPAKRPEDRKEKLHPSTKQPKDQDEKLHPSTDSSSTDSLRGLHIPGSFPA